MLTSLYRLVRNATTLSEAAGRRRARHVLLGLNDRLLADAGISRELLNRGVSAWPWREDEATAEQPVSVAPVATFPGRHRFISETYDQDFRPDRIAA